jgi:hypothetical protein
MTSELERGIDAVKAYLQAHATASPLDEIRESTGLDDCLLHEALGWLVTEHRISVDSGRRVRLLSPGYCDGRDGGG